MFGTAEEELASYAPRGIMIWGEGVTRCLSMGELAVRAVAQADRETYRPVTLLLEGPSKAGKTALAVEVARRSDFPFVKIVTSHKMIGFTEVAKCAAIKKASHTFVLTYFAFFSSPSAFSSALGSLQFWVWG